MLPVAPHSMAEKKNLLSFMRQISYSLCVCSLVLLPSHYWAVPRMHAFFPIYLAARKTKISNKNKQYNISSSSILSLFAENVLYGAKSVGMISINVMVCSHIFLHALFTHAHITLCASATINACARISLTENRKKKRKTGVPTYLQKQAYGMAHADGVLFRYRGAQQQRFRAFCGARGGESWEGGTRDIK